MSDLVLQRLSRHGPAPQGGRRHGRDRHPRRHRRRRHRNIAGTHHPLVQLEEELADLHGKEAALLFTSAMSRTRPAFRRSPLIPNCLILSDALNHNSMIEGVRGRLRAADFPPQRPAIWSNC
jgi:hypothetical protein